MSDVSVTEPSNPASEPIVDDGEEEETKEIMIMKQRVEEMEREANMLREMQAAAEKAERASTEAETSTPMEMDEDQVAADSRSIYIGNVDYSATPEEIQAHFQACGVINRVTILCDKFTGHPKGYAYVEFAEADHIDAALALDNSLFKGRLLKVTAKRTNLPGWMRGRGRGRGGYRGGFRGGYRGSSGYSPYRARGRGRGRGH